MRKTTLVALAAGAVVALGCGAGGAAQTGSGGSDTGSTAVAAAKAAKLGDPVRDGKFEFTVKQVTCGAKQIGTDILAKKAQGQFCRVAVVVKNIGTEAQMLSDSDQKAYGSNGAQYSADTEAGMYANEGDSTFLNQINPGNQVTGVLIFDIPVGAKIAKLELHDSAFSGGVVVQLA